MSFARVVFFIDEVAARPFQRELGRVGKIAVVIDDQDARLLFTRIGDLRKKVCFDGSAHNFL
jgi:hypothetical protein